MTERVASPRPDAGVRRRIGGRYALLAPLGSGGMGTVWRGRDEKLGRDVAVKEVRLPPNVSPDEREQLAQRTMREARATAALNHPNVVTVYDVVEEDGRPWIVMELIPARTLAEVLNEDGPLSQRDAAVVGLGVLDALIAAHAAGITHRDVKPGNVLLSRDRDGRERVVLTDFGIAQMAGDPAMTGTGLLLGSPSFMAPERARGQGAGPAGDLYSLGATLYTAVEGRAPHDRGEPLPTLAAVVSDPPDEPRYAGALRPVLAGLLEKDPERRMSAQEARGLLSRIAMGAVATQPKPAPAPAAPTGPVNRTVVVPPVAAPPPAPSARDDGGARSGAGRPPRGSRPYLVPLLLLLALAALAVLAVALATAGDPGGSASPQPSTSPSARSSAGSPTPQQSSAAPRSSAPQPTQPQQPQVPAGFRLYRDPSGYAVAVPASWQQRNGDGNIVDFVDPAGGRFLRFDRTDSPKPDPKKDWERASKSAEKSGRFPNYEEVSIESVDYRGWKAADWEFTFGGEDEGTRTHVRNRGFITDESHAYAIYLSARESVWEDSQQYFETAADTFQPDR